ncbi:MAG: hypothetical protein VKP72_05210 [bacterium]|nr:hypothetical protein [bacterium]
MTEPESRRPRRRAPACSWWRDHVRLEVPRLLDETARRQLERLQERLVERGVRAWELDASRLGARDALSLARLASLCARARRRGAAPRVTGLHREARRWLSRAELHALVPFGSSGGDRDHVDPAASGR